MLRTALALLIASVLLGCSDPKRSDVFPATGVHGQEGNFEGFYKIPSGDASKKIRVGHWIFRYEDPTRKRAEGEYKNGKRDGDWTFWNESGSIDTEKSGIYEDGKKTADLPKKK
ncbi:MAG: hypothetical protein HRU14_14610 [Planctomycetes bacterium]|nr:hypothetical protein [Planctomycetota bacterium]